MNIATIWIQTKISRIMKIPQVYKQTELGIIPEDWEVVNFCEVADNFTGLTYAPENVKNYGTLVLRSSNIQDGFLSYEDNVYVDGINIPDRAKAKVGDILVCVRNGSRNLIGKSALISSKSPKDLAFGAFMTVLRAKNGTHNIFIHQIWQSDYIQRQIKDNLGATINQITNKDISRYIIPMPPIAEQRAIAEALSDVDGLIAALDKKIAKKRLLKQGAMQQLLTGKKRLPGFTDKWVEKSFADIFIHISTRNHQIDSSLYQSVGKYPIVDQGQIPIVGYTDDVEPIVCEQDGTIIFGDHTRIFKYVNYNFCVGADGTQVLFCKNNMCTKFIYYLCCIMETPNTGYNRHYKYVKDNVYTIPSDIKEQQAIATILSDMDKEIADLEAQRDKYRLLKSGMMQKLLTGQIRLK